MLVTLVTFEQYLGLLGRLYVQGVTADVHPNLLRRLGGSLALAGRDAQWIRIEENAALGFIDMRRDRADIDRIARRRWGEYRAAIERRIAAGESGRAAVENMMRGYGTVPHAPRHLERMTAPSTGPAGTAPRWLYDIAVVRQRFERGGEIMADTFGSLTTGAYLIATAQDWTNATPEEWDRAFNAGEIGMTVGQIVEGAGGVSQARQAQRTQGRSVATSTPAVVERSVTPQTRGTARGASTAVQRGTTSSTGTSTARGTRPAAPQPAPTRPRQAPQPADDLNIDAALAPGAPHRTSRLRRAERPRHRTGPRAGQSYQRLDALLATMTSQQRRAALRLINRFPTSFLAVWHAVNTPGRRRNMREVLRLWHAGQQEEARRLARRTYDSHRRSFWRRVRRHPDLMQMLNDAGLRFEGGPTTAPFWRLPNGTKEVLSLEHTERVKNVPWRAVVGRHIRMVPLRENFRMLEFIRETDPFQNPPAPPPGAVSPLAPARPQP